VFEIEPASGRLVAHAQVPVLAGEAGERAEPMGVALYKRPTDGAVFAIVAPKTGDATGYLAQYRLADDGAGRLAGTRVRRFGNFNTELRDDEGGIGEIEAVVVDDELGFVYYSDEFHGIRKWHADPDHPDAARELAVFGTTGYVADREGLGIYRTGPGTGYVVSTDQIDGGSVLKFYRRAGTAGDVHAHDMPVHEVKTPADATDGIEVLNAPLPGLPEGLVVMMNSTPRNFLVFDWRHLQP
jgi:3-phytase